MNEDQILSYIDEAIKVRSKAYAKYSNFKVGAILIDNKDNMYKGVNVENSSYGLSNCAERSAIFSAVSGGMKNIKVLCVVGDTSNPISPCGACRQVIKEFSNDETVIILSNLKKEYKVYNIEELLPYGFKL
ncbi:MAG: cytidine deaminase [Fusobacterium sp. JB019]|nr:cytidine deaminase [Fusobacterium sp. JB020]MDP0507424.1 cytidine deaminase [Fusobacterium sp. JB019]